MPLRLAILTPRFWPWTGDAETHWLRLAEAFRQAGHQATVVTPQWHRDWPRQMVVREVPLVRLRGAPLGGLSTLRYMYALTRWLNASRDQLDLVLVSRLRHEAYCALGALAESPIPVVLQAEQAGPEGEVAWHRKASFGSRIAKRCRTARNVVATSEIVQRELVAAQFAAQRIELIPRGVPIPPPQSAAGREQARAAVASVNHDLIAATEHPVALALARFEPREGLADLVQAWRPIAARWPAARLWIVGDGPQREALFRLISDLDLRYQVLLPGTFSPTDELYPAADLFIRPATSEGPTLRMAEALAAGVPVVATDLPGHREWIEPEQTGLLVPPGDIRALTAAIQRMLDEPAIAIGLAAAARQRMKEIATLESCVAKYLALFERVTNDGR